MANLYNKYRPQDFSDVTEQSLVVTMLREICKEKPLRNRNFLLTGPAGTGKTTMARIVAKVLNDGSADYIEVDAASHGSAESIREIVRQAQSYPVGTNYKVFIIDEVHAVSSAGWSIFLKTLEESPAKSVFLMCTTNPEKIPPTILSRVQTFQLSKISTEGIHNRLIHVIREENKSGANIEYDPRAVAFIAKLANGGMRDALTLLDRVLVYSKDITSENVVAALDLPNYDDYFSLLRAYAKKDNESLCKLIDEAYNSGINFIKWMEGFHSFVMNVLKYIFLKDVERTTIPSHYESKISQYGPQHAVVCMRLSNRLVEMLPQLKSSQYLQEIALSYLCSSN